MILAASNVALGHTEEARRVAQRALSLKPGLSLEDYALSQPFKEQRRLEQLLDQLRNAGLS
jgi:hypothetical protein